MKGFVAWLMRIAYRTELGKIGKLVREERILMNAEETGLYRRRQSVGYIQGALEVLEKCKLLKP